jgi:hypothetical protein
MAVTAAVALRLRAMSNHGGRRSRRRPAHLHETVAVYLKMQQCQMEAVFAELLAEHDRLTDLDGVPRLALRTLVAFRRGPANSPGGRFFT